ncbi:TolC family outer membrane protein [Novosphingobium sp.]|uniref:TolC family outer membrane protein n=1 Tax=Novosphingobium sp. TaxID=1874826 RepID=UPI003D110531
MTGRLPSYPALALSCLCALMPVVAGAQAIQPPGVLEDDTVTYPSNAPCPPPAKTGQTHPASPHPAKPCPPGSVAAKGWAPPAFALDAEPPATETLGQALRSAYETAPTLQAQRYLLRASGEDYALAEAELRPTSELQVTGTYQKTVPGRVTQATRFLAPSPIITSNTLAASAMVTQPLYTGGRAAADMDAANAEIRAGREQLRGTEGDVLLQVVTAYSDIRRDSEILRLYSGNVRQLQAIQGEVGARRVAGELTRTDIAQAETQVQVAEAAYNSAQQQMEQDRATYTALVGHDPRVLAPAPPLPNMPASVGEAFDFAQQTNPGLGQAIETERESRARIASAKAAGRPTVALTGTATLTGGAAPFYLYNQDQVFSGQAVLTIPLTNGGKVGAAVAQAEDRNAADRIGIETARRQMVDSIINAWNAIATTQRNIDVAIRERASARVFDEGTFQEYRLGLRATFDVLYAHSTLLNAEVSLVSARHDLYVAQATLLRYIGVLEERSLQTGAGLYDPATDLRHAEARGATPLDGLVLALDKIARPVPIQPPLQQPPLGADAAAMVVPPVTFPLVDQAHYSPIVPIQGTIGAPIEDRSLSRP